MEKTCSHCGETKDIAEFRHGPGYKGGYRTECRSCERERYRLWKKRNPDKYRAKWQRDNDKRKENRTGNYDRTPERRAMSRNNHLVRKYGITLADEDALIEAQGGKCAACGREERLVVDHCHKSSAVRAMLCNNCNVVLGLVDDDVDHLRKIIQYIESFTAR